MHLTFEHALFKKLTVPIIFIGLLSACATQNIAQISKLERPDSGLSILLLPIDVELSELSAGGASTTRADWTIAAKDNLSIAVKDKLREFNVKTAPFNQPAEESPEFKDITELHALHAAVGHAVQLHLFTPGMELPSKKRSLDWTLGPRANILRERYKADYALFIHVRNTYADGGRVAYGLALVLLFGIAIPMGEQVGFASLVDLKNGDVVWYNKLHRAGGDMRTLEPTRESANVLLASMPK